MSRYKFRFTTALQSLCTALLLAVLLLSCSNKPEAIKDLGEASYQLVNSDSTSVNFPQDYQGDIAVISFIYTHCPDVCPAITANLKNIQSGLKDTSGVQFIEISFDPQRDTPSVLKEYKNLFQLNSQFSLLTGDPATVDSLLNRLDIIAKKTQIDSLGQDSSRYDMKHSNKIYLMDEDGKIRAEYPASIVPPKNVIEDIQKLR